MRGTRGLGALALLAAIGLSGCGGHEVDQEAWKRELADVGQTPGDMAKLEKVTRGLCDDDQKQLETFVAVAKDAGSSMEALRINFRNVCPDQLDKLQKAESAQQDNVDRAKRICDMPPSARNQDEKDLAEAMGC
jgi:hypothetical protein